MVEHRRSGRVSKPNRTQVEEICSLRSKLARLEHANSQRAQIAEAYRALGDNSVQGLAIISDKGMVFANQRLADITGYSVDELKAMSAEEVRALIHPEDRTAVWTRRRDWLVGILQRGSYEFGIIHKDGSVRWLESHASRIQYQGFQAVQVACVDITRCKEVQEALRESESKLKRAQEVAHVGSWHLDMDTRQVAWSDETYRIFGLPIGQPMQEDDFLRSVHPDDLSYVRQAWADALQGGPYDIEHRIIAHGTVKWVREKALLKFDGEGKPLHGIGTVQDITDHKKFVEALEQGEMWLRSIFRVAPVGIGVVSGRVLTMVNTRMCEMVGYSREELLGQNIRMLYATDEDDGYVGQEERGHIHEKGLGTVETRFRRKDGQFIDVLLSSTLLYPNAASKAITFTALDITDRKVSEYAIRFERDKAQQYLDIAEVMLVALNKEGRVTFVNKKGCRILGFHEDEIVGKDWFETFLLERVKVRARKIFSEITAGRVELYERVDGVVVCRDGEEKLIEWHNTVLTDEAGVILGSLSSGQDITSQRRVERTLQKSEASLKRAQEVAHVGSWRLDLRTRRLEWSDETYRIFGVPIGSPVDQGCFFSHVHPDDLSYVRRLWHAALGGTPYEATHRIIAEGTVKWVLDRGVLEFNAQGEPVCAVGTVQDITERKRAEERLELRALVLDQIQDHATVTDLSGNITYVNKAVATSLGCTCEQLIGQNWVLYGFAPAQGATQREIIDKTKEEGSWRGEVINHDADGREIIMDCRTQLVSGRNGQAIALCGTATDVTKHRQIEEEIRKSEERFRHLYENSVLGIYRTTPDGRIVSANPTLIRMLGFESFEELAQRNLEKEGFGPEPPRSWFKEQVESCGELRGISSNWITRQGRSIWVRENARAVLDESGTVLFYDGTVEDITNLVEMKKQAKQREAEMLHLSRLSTLGEMATELAHELNQPLSAIISYGGACLRQAESPTLDLARMARNQKLIQEQALRAREIMKGVKRFAQRRQPNRRKVNLGEPITNAVSLLRWEFRHKNIGLRLNVKDEKTVIYADAIQIEQVLVNLLQNAAEAMEQSGPSCCVAIETKVSAANQVQVIVSDTGTGVSKENMSRLFEPFFTTKSTGVGLGLSTSRSIIEMHDGTLEAKRNSDGGMTFVLTLPMAPPQEQQDD